MAATGFSHWLDFHDHAINTLDLLAGDLDRPGRVAARHVEGWHWEDHGMGLDRPAALARSDARSCIWRGLVSWIVKQVVSLWRKKVVDQFLRADELHRELACHFAEGRYVISVSGHELKDRWT